MEDENLQVPIVDVEELQAEPESAAPEPPTEDLNLYKGKLDSLEAELDRTIEYLNKQIESIEMYEEPSREAKTFKEEIFSAKKMMVEQKINAMKSLFALYIEGKKSEEDSGSGKDITAFLN